LGDRKREAIRSTFRQILREAGANETDLLLIAGDLFEHDRITRDTVEFLKLQFESIGDIRVFIAPGNHDPYLRGSPYCEETWPANVHIFREEEFRSVELPELGIRITGFGFNGSQVEDHIFAKLPALPDDLWNIVLAHGSDVSRIPEGKSAHGPFLMKEVAGKNIRYCALGHYHQARLLENPSDDAQVRYCGIPEGRGWDEEDAGTYLSGVLDESGRIQVQSIPCIQYPFKTIALECDGFTSREQIIEAILQQKDVSYDTRTILRVRLKGYLDPKVDLSLAEMGERLADETLYLHWEDGTLPAIDFQSLAQEKTLRGRFVRELNERIAAANEEDRPVLVQARFFGAQALSGSEVRPR